MVIALPNLEKADIAKPNSKTTTTITDSFLSNKNINGKTADEKRKASSAVVATINEAGKLVCPVCGTTQNATNEMCYSCATRFKK